MINSELLKEAIADAKAVRATALANAKAALEEAFAPRFEAMFAEKLKEESEEEQEEGLQEVEAPNQVSGKGGEAKGPHTKAVTKGNPKQPKSGAGDKDFKPVKVGKGPSDVANPSKTVNETAEEEDEGKEEMDEQYEEEEGAVEEAGLTSEDLDEIIKELENEVAYEEEGTTMERRGAPSVPAEEEPAPPEAGEENLPPVAGDEFGNGEPPETNVDAEPGSEVDIDLGPERGPEAGEMGATGGEEEEPEEEPQGMNAGEPMTLPTPKHGVGDEMGDEDENINLEELIAALNEEAEEEDEGKEEEEMDESLQNNGVPTNELAGQNKTGGTNTYPKGPDASKKQLPGKNHNIMGKGNIGTGATGGKPMEEAIQYKVALKEAYNTIEFLRGQINEVNLLNAKLLYTNKLFKEFAGVLDDSYRMKIVESFDLTKSVREVKLAYALLAESLNFGTQVMRSQKVVKTALRPSSTSTKGQVKQITEGFASKPVSSTRPSQLITEGNGMVLRFKKLAGIKEAPKTTTTEKK